MLRGFVTLLSIGLFLGISWVLVALPDQPTGLTTESLQHLPNSGVTNPVTAVLLNYRAYDTLLEIGVLFLAILGVWSMRAADQIRLETTDRPLLSALLGVGLPVLIISGGYLLWAGAFAPGGAFQGGALMGGAIVLTILSGVTRLGLRTIRWFPMTLGLGLLVFAAVALGLLWTNGYLLRYSVATAGTWILVIESAALISIGITLGALFMGGRIDRSTQTGSSGREHD
jgi:multisubunit Na+/H+ antiporter MnhB subunit